MQAARRVLASAGIMGRRNMTTAAQLAADASKPKGSIVDTIGVWTVTPLAVGVFIYDMFISHEVRVGAVCGFLTLAQAPGQQGLIILLLLLCEECTLVIALILPLPRPALRHSSRSQTSAVWKLT
jgi:hypothetical protein